MSLCPICKAQAAPRTENRAFPFCSPRCRQVDLGKWLDEGYRVATMDSEGDPDEFSPPTPSPTEDGASEASPRRGHHGKK